MEPRLYFFIISEHLPKPHQISKGLGFEPRELEITFPKWMKSLFQNEWDFLGIFAPLWHKGERRYGEEEGTLKSQKGPRSIISLNHENFLSLIKVIKQKWKWMKILVDFFKISFYDWKKNEKKMLMGIGWGLCHRKTTRVSKYLNHQSPQPNPHTFFFTL